MKKNILLFIILSTIASAINYFAYPALGRILPASQYVDITVALSLFTQVTTFLSSINAITIGLTKENESDPKEIVHSLQSSLFKVFVVLIAIFLAISPFILEAIGVPLQFSLPISLLMLASLPLTIMSGYLNGKQSMIKLGSLAVISAGFQFTFGVIAAFLSRDGFVTMTFMALAQICAIITIRQLFHSERLPSPFPTLNPGKAATSSQLSRHIITYATIASIAIMLINLVQIADLLIITRHNTADAKFYTDLYIISRIMFFAGMIFIWPFLGSIDVTNHNKNRIPLTKLVAVFSLLAFGMIIPLISFGPLIIHLLLGVWYTPGDIALVGSLSILFKLFLLIATAITLYFMVIRSFIAVYYSLSLCATITVYSVLSSPGITTLQTILQLTIIAGVGAITGILLFALQTRKKD